MRHYTILLLFIGLYCVSLTAHYPYYAPQSLSYHRYEREHLFTLDTHLSYGSCTEAHNTDKVKTNVLGIYNQEQLHQVGKNIVNQDITQLNSLILDALWHVVPTDNSYGTLNFAGSFNSLNGNIGLGYNITESFFVAAQLPFYTIEIKNPTQTDATSTIASTVEWTAFLAHFNAILQDANLSQSSYKKNGFGDARFSLGWVRNVEELGQLFALDTIIQLGMVAGTAEEQDPTKVFSVAPGNNKHNGFFFMFDTHIGVSQYLTLSFHTEQTVFLKRDCTRRIKTAPGQNGWIKLSQTTVNEEWGNKYSLGGYLTYNPIDIISFSTGYTYYHQNRHTLVPTDSLTYSSSIMNSDIMLQPWSMHTFHFLCEINGADRDHMLHPRVALSYNRIIQSHNTFLNHTGSGTLGLAITAEF